jgi:hypothetical protein
MMVIYWKNKILSRRTPWEKWKTSSSRRFNV